MERPSPNDSDPIGKPRDPIAPAGDDDVRPDSPPQKPKVTPLDEGKAIQEDIEIKET